MTALSDQAVNIRRGRFAGCTAEKMAAQSKGRRWGATGVCLHTPDESCHQQVWGFIPYMYVSFRYGEKGVLGRKVQIVSFMLSGMRQEIFEEKKEDNLKERID